MKAEGVDQSHVNFWNMMGLSWPSSNPESAVVVKSLMRLSLYSLLLVFRVVVIRWMRLASRLAKLRLLLKPDSSPKRTHFPSRPRSYRVESQLSLPTQSSTAEKFPPFFAISYFAHPALSL